PGAPTRAGPHTRERPGPVGRGVVVSLCGGSACAGAPALLEQVHPLLEQLVQILERATLEQHVPVGTRRLDLLGLGRRSVDELTLLAVLAHPGAGDLGVVSERHLVDVPAGRLVLGQPPGCEVGDRKSTRLNSSHVSISYAV